MNKLLIEDVNNFVENNKKFTEYLIKNEYELLTLALIESIATLGCHIDDDADIIQNELYDIFVYLNLYNDDFMEDTINNRTQIDNLNKEFFTVIADLSDLGLEYPVYEFIVNICNEITHKHFNQTYEEFLIEYLQKN